MTEQLLILWSTMMDLGTITAVATNCLGIHLPYGENIYNLNKHTCPCQGIYILLPVKEEFQQWIDILNYPECQFIVITQY